MTTTARNSLLSTRQPSSPSIASPLARPNVAVVCAILVLVQLVFANQYGYHPDELYFRQLGERGPAWGYVDQPPMLPLLVDLARAVFGDSLWAIRTPAIVCGVLTVVLGTLIAAEFGAARRAQTLAAIGLATSMTVLTFGRWILTSSVDTVAWCAVMLFALRALLRRDGRWWLAAGLVVGVSLYAKFIILLLVVSIVVGMLLVGPLWHLRERWIYLGGVLAAVIGLPNFVYQVAHNFPQVEMANAMGQLDGEANRAMFWSNLFFVLGPGLMPIVVAGLLGLWRLPEWRPAAPLGVGYLLGTAAAYLTEGGRPDYTGALLITFFAAGCVRVERWLRHRRLRTGLVAAGLLLTIAAQVLLALPVVPRSSLKHFQINSMTLETLGWPEMVGQVGQVYQSLPPQDRARTIILADNFGQAGAIDRYGAAYQLPPVYSGINELHGWGPPPPGAGEVVVAVGVPVDRLAADFADCSLEARIDNGLEVDNPEQGRAISVCRGPRAAWTELWPRYRHLSAYE